MVLHGENRTVLVFQPLDRAVVQVDIAHPSQPFRDGAAYYRIAMVLGGDIDPPGP